MSDVLSSLTVLKRKLMTCLSSAATILAGTFALPRTPLADSVNTEEDINADIDTKGIDQSKAIELINGYGDLLGVIIFVPFEGPIKAYPVAGAGKEIQINPPGYQLPEPRTTLARTNFRIEVFDASPRHAVIEQPGGDSICIQVP